MRGHLWMQGCLPGGVSQAESYTGTHNEKQDTGDALLRTNASALSISHELTIYYAGLQQHHRETTRKHMSDYAIRCDKNLTKQVQGDNHYEDRVRSTQVSGQRQIWFRPCQPYSLGIWETRWLNLIEPEVPIGCPSLYWKWIIRKCTKVALLLRDSHYPW